jgi:hypothetical protein
MSTSLPVVACVLGALLFLGVGAPVSWLALRELRRAWASRAWASVPGCVLESRVEAEADLEGTTYRPRVTYAYMVAGKEFTAEGVFIGQGPTASRRRAERAAQRYPVGKRVAVYYDASAPSRAVLEIGLGCRELIALAVPAFFLACSLSFAVLAVALALDK